MGKLVYIMGKSGTGKSRSMKNIPADQFGLINPEGKDLPFGKDAPAFKVERIVSDRSDEIVDHIKAYAGRYKIVVLDDFQTVMTNEFMRRSSEMGYQKWTDIGKHVWDIAEAAKEIPDDCILYVLCHTEENDNGGEKIKTLGKLLDQNVVLESKSTIVLKTGVEDGKYFFCTQNNGRDTVKSPEGMFPSYAVQNDLKYVDDAIRNYYGLRGSKTDEEMAAEHAEASQDGVKPDTGRKSRRKAEKAESGDPKRTREEIKQSNDEKIKNYVTAQQEAVDAVAGDRDEVPFEEAMDAAEKVPKPELGKVPRRTRADRSAKAEEAVHAEEPAQDGGTSNDDTSKDGGILTEDTYFFIPEKDNYVMKHAGDSAPEGGEEITLEEYREGVARIAKENMPELETRGRRRRTRG